MCSGKPEAGLLRAQQAATPLPRGFLPIGMLNMSSQQQTRLAASCVSCKYDAQPQTLLFEEDSDLRPKRRKLCEGEQYQWKAHELPPFLSAATSIGIRVSKSVQPQTLKEEEDHDVQPQTLKVEAVSSQQQTRLAASSRHGLQPAQTLDAEDHDAKPQTDEEKHDAQPQTLNAEDNDAQPQTDEEKHDAQPQTLQDEDPDAQPQTLQEEGHDALRQTLMEEYDEGDTQVPPSPQTPFDPYVDIVR